MMGSDWYGAGGWMAGGWLWMFLGTILFVLLVAWAVRAFGSSVHPDVPDDRRSQPTALDILNVRFAKGEIGEEEYADKRRKLSGS